MMIAPDATLGMLGGGQLGRMFALAAAEMGYHVWVLDPLKQSPAGEVAQRHICADYEDTDALAELGERCSVVTTEFENVPSASLDFLSRYCLVHPNARAVQVCQNRIREKTFINELGIPTSPFVAINTAADLSHLQGLRWPCILKTAQFGYDGKGQQTVHSAEEVKAAYAQFGEVPCILEQRIDLACEISVVMGRNTHGNVCFFPIAENEHRDGILHLSSVPARVSGELQEQAKQIAERIALALDYVGIMTVEYFIDGQGHLLVNEIAPRVHNSGHYTMDACHVSQFAQQVRMICGWPQADTKNYCAVAMVNILGDAWIDGRLKVEELLGDVNVYLHLYGKDVPKPGRKMGHFNVLADDVETARNYAAQVYRCVIAG